MQVYRWRSFSGSASRYASQMPTAFVMNRRSPMASETSTWVWNAIRSSDFSSRSGGIDGLPTALYISSNTGDKSASAWSAIRLTGRNG